MNLQILEFIDWTHCGIYKQIFHCHARMENQKWTGVFFETDTFWGIFIRFWKFCIVIFYYETIITLIIMMECNINFGNLLQITTRGTLKMVVLLTKLRIYHGFICISQHCCDGIWFQQVLTKTPCPFTTFTRVSVSLLTFTDCKGNNLAMYSVYLLVLQYWGGGSDVRLRAPPVVALLWTPSDLLWQQSKKNNRTCSLRFCIGPVMYRSIATCCLSQVWTTRFPSLSAPPWPEK